MQGEGYGGAQKQSEEGIINKQPGAAVARPVVAAPDMVIPANPPAPKVDPNVRPATPAANPQQSQAAQPMADSGDVSAKKKQYDKPGDMKIDPAKTYTATIDTDAG